MKSSGLLNLGDEDLMDNANQRGVKEIAGPDYRKWPWAEIGNKDHLWQWRIVEMMRSTSKSVMARPDSDKRLGWINLQFLLRPTSNSKTLTFQND
jgi:hypothetical protein